MASAMDPADGEAKTLSCTIMIALSDVMIVSANVGGRTFQGAIIDIEKCGATHPLGVTPSEGFADRLLKDNPRDYASEMVSFGSASQRHTYYSRPASTASGAPSFRRLRARHVLCSSCRGVCDDRANRVRARAKRTSLNTKVKISKESSAMMASWPHCRWRVPTLRKLEQREIDLHTNNRNTTSEEYILIDDEQENRNEQIKKEPIRLRISALSTSPSSSGSWAVTDCFKPRIRSVRDSEEEQVKGERKFTLPLSTRMKFADQEDGRKYEKKRKRERWDTRWEATSSDSGGGGLTEVKEEVVCGNDVDIGERMDVTNDEISVIHVQVSG